MAAVVFHQKPAARKLASKRVSPIPRRVLNALNLKQPVVGVFRHKNRPHYGVAYRDAVAAGPFPLPMAGMQRLPCRERQLTLLLM